MNGIQKQSLFCTMQLGIMTVVLSLERRGFREIARVYNTELDGVQDSQNFLEHQVAVLNLFRLSNRIYKMLNDSEGLKDLTQYLVLSDPARIVPIQ